jgi:hypothetical protein
LLKKLGDRSPEEALAQLLGPERAFKLKASIHPPKQSKAEQENTPDLAPAELAQQEAWQAQQSLLAKLRVVADEARTYEQDTGVHTLNVGFPVLSLPPGTISSSGRGAAAKRVLAPIAFIPVTIKLRASATPSVEIASHGAGVDRVLPNTALLAWLEQQTGVPTGELFADEQGVAPWREIQELVLYVARALKLGVPAPFAETPAPEFPGSDVPAASASEAPPLNQPVQPAPAGKESSLPAEPTASGARPELIEFVPGAFSLNPAPRADDEPREACIVTAAVLGLFPMNNQGLLRDTQAMLAGEALDGPVTSFIQAGVSLDQPAQATYEHEAWSGQKRPRNFSEERLATASDPCQTRAVRLARECRGLVIHGPPGTGKSQTITNIIGDHLARGERVLMVCDKRTALDVVANRLEHLGLGSLCALVYDPRRDQHDLYKSIREQLENLGDTKTDARAEAKRQRLDQELGKLHAELSQYWSLLMERDTLLGSSFHELMGQWQSAAVGGGPTLDPESVRGFRAADFETSRADCQNLFSRAERVGFAEQVWARCAGLRLEDFLAQPLAAWQSILNDCKKAAADVDAAADPAIPPFDGEASLEEQARARAELANSLRTALAKTPADLRTQTAGLEARVAQEALRKLKGVAGFRSLLDAGPLDPEIHLVVQDQPPGMAAIAGELGAVEAYLAVAGKWYGIFFWSRRAHAAEVLVNYGLPPGPASAERLRTFLIGLRARQVLHNLLAELRGPNASPPAAADDVLSRLLAEYEVLLDLLNATESLTALHGLAEPVRKALVDPAAATRLLTGLDKSAAAAAALGRLERRLTESGMFEASWLKRASQDWQQGSSVRDDIDPLHDRLDSLEEILRVRQAVGKLPSGIQPAVSQLLAQPLGGDVALAALHQAVLGAEIQHRLRASPEFQTFDGQRLNGCFDRYRELEQQKQELVRTSALQLWVGRQQERLLVSTGSRLSSGGADLRRRLTLRGERALRLRQVIAIGQEIEGGDPLFDLRPVWLASPETVAQVFPRQPLFEAVIFDEASQCRLEEALPVLTRAKRVVISGDPKQLPPTRFFESAVAASDVEDIESDEQLFEAHQTEIEDLLGAALSIDIQQCYLDVHYRSRNADLISFSNEQFYSRRLQPIPGHPANRARFAPITLYRADGIYQERTNAAEAARVCQIVHDLLRRAEPPSIGIASFNLAQRDLIAEKLDELAAADPDFAARLAEARQRPGHNSFEGLFVKNLENVQGDERDHIIISTTYGPDAQGRFYRRFGPLGRAGGGRRLNVLVTRAREEVHLVTSIPRSVYASLPPVPSGQTAGGGWLLFAYLAYAERLAQIYEEAHELLAHSEAAGQGAVNVWPSQQPSLFAEAFARQLARSQGVGSVVHWGNEGFCVDVALQHPRDADNLTVGVLCDGVRFAQAEDPAEWDVFRTGILAGQGWRLHRLWTPHFFRDPQSCRQAIMREAADILAKEEAPDVIKVVREDTP